MSCSHFSFEEMVYLRRVIEIPESFGWPPGYVLKLRDELKVTPCPGGGFFLSEYDVCFKLTAAYARKVGRQYSAGVRLVPEQDDYGRWDLRQSAR